MTLNDFFQKNRKAALAYSGGVDSSYLLYEGLKQGADLKPYFIQTAFQPACERSDAEEFCRRLGVPLTVVELDVLHRPDIAENSPLRCYHCKRTLFSALIETGREGWLRSRAGRHERFGRCVRSSRHAGPFGTGRPLTPAGVWHHKGYGAARNAQSRPFRLGQALQLLPGYEDSSRHGNHGKCAPDH
jgi:hypothetical protein